MTKPINHWTPANDAELRRLAAEKKTAREIGEIMGKSKNSIIGRAKRISTALIHGFSGSAVRKARKNKEIVFKAEISPVQQKDGVGFGQHQKTENPPQIEPYEGAEWPFTTQTIPAGRCRWIEGKIALADSPMCGHEVYAEGKPWCEHHMAIAYQPISPKRDPVKEAMRKWGSK